MITPNKAVSLEATALGLSTIILDHGPGSIELIKLYNMVSKSFESIDQFLLTVDLLYALGRLEVDLQKRMVFYVA